MTEHAIISPSSLHRTTPCPGWIKNASLLPVLPATEKSLEGDAGHYVAFRSGLGETFSAGQVCPNGVEVTDEMLDGAAMYLEAVGYSPGAGETTVPVVRVHEDCFGTPDWWTWDVATHTLRVVDYKFGRLFVDVWENHQLVTYAVGLMDFLGLNEADVILELVVVQPRCYHPDGPVRTWKVAPALLRAFVNDMHASAHEATDNPKPPTKSGPHCLHCPARGSCMTYQKTTGNIIDFVGIAQPVLQTPGDVGRELAVIQDMRDRLKGRQTGLEAMAEQFIKEGKTVPFFSMANSRGRLAWLPDVSVDEVESVVQMTLGKSALKARALLTPTQTKALFKKADAAVISAYATRPNGALKLVRDNLVKLSRVFQK